MTLRFLVTRPEPDARATLERLAALDIEAVAAPLMTRQTLDTGLPSAEGFAAMAITSTNALRALADRGVLAGYSGLPLFAVGDRTAHEARSMGFSAVTSASGAFADLAATIALARVNGPIFYPAGRHLSADLAHALAPQGIMVVTTEVYEMIAVAVPPPALSQMLKDDGKAHGVMLYSRRTAEIFCALTKTLPLEHRRYMPMLCLSEKVAEPLLEHHFARVLLADHPSEEAMMALALAFAREQSEP